MVKVNLCSLMTVVQEMVLFLVMKVLVFFVHVLDPGVRKYVLYICLSKNNDAAVNDQ